MDPGSHAGTKRGCSLLEFEISKRTVPAALHQPLDSWLCTSPSSCGSHNSASPLATLQWVNFKHQIHTRIRICTYTLYIYIYIYIYVCVYIYIYIYIYTAAVRATVIAATAPRVSFAVAICSVVTSLYSSGVALGCLLSVARALVRAIGALPWICPLQHSALSPRARAPACRRACAPIM